MSDWKLAYTTGLEHLAEIFKQVLNDNGIEAIIFNRKDSSYLFGAIEVMVKSEDLDKAILLAKEFEENTRI
ncbi:MAG: DUF2007 domain-containing protein [Bacteroidales bacterium]|nr:DUF2007 domain-containing protein [Bacteroidales bacterium]